jgi:hypothetical protein
MGHCSPRLVFDFGARGIGISAQAQYCYNALITAENFERVIRAFQKRAPFRSFMVELSSGTRIDVDHPEALVFRGGVAVFLSELGVPTLFDHESVAQVADAADQRAA